MTDDTVEKVALALCNADQRLIEAHATSSLPKESADTYRHLARAALTAIDLPTILREAHNAGLREAAEWHEQQALELERRQRTDEWPPSTQDIIAHRQHAAAILAKVKL
jgi:hypothetical protein